MSESSSEQRAATMKRHPLDRFLLAAVFTTAASAAAAQPADGTLKFMGAEIPLGPTVRGAPYSAEATTTLTQTLGDGTRINRTVTARLYRDGEGRIRREQTILGLGALDPSADGQTIITIVDPVAHVQYVLDPRTREARRLAMFAGVRKPLEMLAMKGKLEAMGQAVERMPGGNEIPPPPPPPPPPGGSPLVLRRSPTGAQPGTAQSLGHRQIEGVDAVGTRRSETIPAGKIGNDRPIEVTDERWDSAELGLVVLSQHHDPRTGDLEYRLTNISRAEPPHDLFAVPSDYTVVEGPPPPPLPPPAPRPPEVPQGPDIP